VSVARIGESVWCRNRRECLEQEQVGVVDTVSSASAWYTDRRKGQYKNRHECLVQKKADVPDARTGNSVWKVTDGDT
jgi:hypothetical protein